MDSSSQLRGVGGVYAEVTVRIGVRMISCERLCTQEKYIPASKNHSQGAVDVKADGVGLPKDLLNVGWDAVQNACHHRETCHLNYHLIDRKIW